MEAKQYTESKIEQHQDFEELSSGLQAAPQLQPLPYVDDEVDPENAPKQKKANFILPLIRIILRKSWLIAIPTIALGAAAFVYVPKSPIAFKGYFRLLVEPLSSEEQKAEPGALTGTGVATKGLDYTTQIQVLRSPKILLEIVEQVQNEYPEFNEFELNSGLFISQVQIGKNQREGQTKLIEVQYQALESKKVLVVLEKIAEKYLAYSLNERKSRINSGVGFIDEQIPELREKVNSLQDELETLQKKHNITDIGVLSSELATQRNLLKSQKNQTIQELSQQRALYTNLQRSLGITTSEVRKAFALTQRTRYQELLVRLQQVEAQIASESARFKEDSPVIELLRNQQETILESLREEAEITLDEKIANIENNPQLLWFPNQTRQARILQLVDIQAQIDILSVRKQVLEQEERLLEEQTRDFPSIARQYQQLQNQLQIAQNNLYRFLENREKLRIEAAQEEIPWELVAEPDFIRHPVTGQVIPVFGESRKKLLLMAVIAGLILGLVPVLSIDILRNIFFTSKDIEDLIPFPMLGSIPLDGGIKKLAIASDDSNSFKLASSAEEAELAGQALGGVSEDPEFLEAFSLMFAKIRFMAADFPIRSLTISSAQVGDGKSTIALHLAQTAALMGQKVLLVDANLRKPALHKMLNLPNIKGLSDLLGDRVSPKDVIERSPLADNLSVMTAGTPTPAVAKQLASPRMGYLMDELDSLFDLVIYDSPQLQNLVDTNFLAEHTDGILMAIAPKKTKLSVVLQVINDLKNFKIEVLGTVANHLK